MINLLCTHCGAPLSAESADRVVTCPFCGASAAPAPRVVERVVERVRVVAASGGEPSAGLHCPRCGEGLRDVRARDRRMRVCRGCGGAWLDVETVAHLTKTDDEELTRAVRRGQGILAPTDVSQRPQINCPECQQPLRRHAVGDTTLDVDACGAHGTWFDRGELATFVATHTNLRAGDVSEEDLAGAGIGRGWF